MDFKDQTSAFDEIMEKLNELQNDSQVIESTKKLIDEKERANDSDEELINGSAPIDQDLFEQIKSDKTIDMPKKKSAIRRFLDEEEEENDEGDEYVDRAYIYEEAPDDIEDFENEDESEEIYRDLKSLVAKMAFKSFIFFILSAVSLYLFAAGFFPGLFGGSVEGVAYPIVLLVLDFICVFVSFGIFSQGLSKLFRAKADTDTLLALLAVSIIVIRIVGLIKPTLFSVSLCFEPFLTLGLYFNVSAKKKIAVNIKNNFKMISIPNEKLTVSVPPSCETNNELILQTGVSGDVMYAHKTKLVSRYIDHSYSDFSWDEKWYRLFFVLVLCIILGSVLIFQLVGVGAALLFPAAALSISTPFFSRGFYASSILKNGKKIRKNGGILTSAKSAKDLEDADLVVISEEDFLEDESVLLQGVKAVGEIQIDDLITNIAALFDKVGTPLNPLFSKMIDRNSVSLPRVDDIYYHEGMGYSCLIHSKMFLVGNRKLMEQFNIEFPENLKNIKLKDSCFPVYVAYHKSPAGVFITSYEQHKRTLDAVRIATDEYVSVGIVSNDFLFDCELLKKLYPAADDVLFRFIPPKTGSKCKEHLEPQNKAPDLIASINGPKGIFACLYGASKLLSALKINSVIRILYAFLSISLMLFIAISGYTDNTAVHALAFQIIWSIPVWLICAFCK